MIEASQATQIEPRGIARYLPILQWTPQYERKWLQPDLIAGLTLGALVVPKSLGYAGIARVPIQNGLYAALAAFGRGEKLMVFFKSGRHRSAMSEMAIGGVF